jgi:hypothetical protein
MTPWQRLEHSAGSATDVAFGATATLVTGYRARVMCGPTLACSALQEAVA